MCGEDLCGRAAVQNDVVEPPDRWDGVRSGWAAGWWIEGHSLRVAVFSVLGYYSMAFLLSGSQLLLLWLDPGTFNFCRNRWETLGMLTELKAGPFLVTQPAHVITVILLNSYVLTEQWKQERRSVRWALYFLILTMKASVLKASLWQGTYSQSIPSDSEESLCPCLHPSLTSGKIEGFSKTGWMPQ